MSRSAPAGAKRLVLAISLVLSAGLCLWLALRRGSSPSIVVLDNTQALEDLFAARGAGTPGDTEAWPPPLLRTPLDAEALRVFYPQLERPTFEEDPIAGLRRSADLRLQRTMQEHPRGGWEVRTNGAGLREDADPDWERIDWWVLVAGDSQTEGVCSNSESSTNLLEAALRGARPGERIEALNAALGGTAPYYYLATLERFRSLRPDVFVPVFYGGNDFKGVMALQRWFHGREPPRDRGFQKRVAERCAALPLGVLPAEVGQLAYFRCFPEDERIAVGTWLAITLEMQRQCEAAGTRLLCVYLPPPLAGQPALYAELRRRVEELTAEWQLDLASSDRWADAWIGEARARGVEVLDLRPAFRAAAEPLFWSEDSHLDLEGHALVAAQLFEALRDSR